MVSHDPSFVPILVSALILSSEGEPLEINEVHHLLDCQATKLRIMKSPITTFMPVAPAINADGGKDAPEGRCIMR